MNLWYFFQEQRLQCLESKLQKTQSKIETTEKEKDSCFYKINKFMIFACFNLSCFFTGPKGISMDLYYTNYLFIILFFYTFLHLTD